MSIDSPRPLAFRVRRGLLLSRLFTAPTPTAAARPFATWTAAPAFRTRLPVPLPGRLIVPESGLHARDQRVSWRRASPPTGPAATATGACCCRSLRCRARVPLTLLSRPVVDGSPHQFNRTDPGVDD